LSLLGFAFAFSVLATSTHQVCAEPAPIASYSIQDATLSGFGGWSHVFTGTVVPVRDFTNGIGGPPGVVADYIDGSGTLNDGVFGGSINSTELFVSGMPDGSVIAPVIALKLARVVSIKSIKLSEGEIDFNLFPGQISGATVTINGISVSLATIPSGTINFLGVAMDDIIDLAGTPLYGASSDTIVISEITFNPITFNQFSLAEITVDGENPAPTVITIDIKPRNDQNRVWQTDASNKVRVAILSNLNFNPASIDENTLTFGRTGDEQSLVGCKGPVDCNGDGILDDLCEFLISATGLQPGDTTAVLKGRMALPTGIFDIVGTAAVEVKPAAD
jgi:hypothetical protein